MSKGRPKPAAVFAIIATAVTLGVLHQDLWWWDDGTLVFGFLPMGLAFHAFYSILAASLWACAVRFAWPHHLDSITEASPDEGNDR